MHALWDEDRWTTPVPNFAVLFSTHHTRMMGLRGGKKFELHKWLVQKIRHNIGVWWMERQKYEIVHVDYVHVRQGFSYARDSF